MSQIEQTDLLVSFLPANCDPEKVDTFLDTLAESDVREAEQLAEYDRALIRASHEETIVALLADIARLNREKIVLQEEVEALHLVDIERLLVFLPAIFRNFWGVVSPAELALMVGTLRIPNISSPYLDPSPDTVATLKRQLKSLPESDRCRIVEFCSALQHRLDIRSEMREFFKKGLA